ncbi:MAG: hypothetical protein ACP5H5_02345 [Pyrobaculum sp.]
MRLVVLSLALAVVALANILPTESLDTFYWARPDSVKIVGLDGRELWSQSAIYPLIATDRAGRCLAVANRLYIYEVTVSRGSVTRSFYVDIELAPEIVEALAQYGARVPQRIPVLLNLTLPLPPIVLAAVHKTTIVSLHTPYGYPLWAVNLGPRANVTAVATNCEYVVAATVFGEVYVLRDGRIIDRFLIDPGGLLRRESMARPPLDPPVTSLTIYNYTVYVGTSTGEIYRFRLPTEIELRTGRYSPGLTRLGACGGAVYGLYVDAAGDPVALCFIKRERPYVAVYPYGLLLADPVLVTYGIDTPRFASAMSQDGRWLYVALGNEIVGIRDGRVSWRTSMPAKPSAVAASWNGSVVAVGTQAGHLYLFKDGLPVVRTDPITTQLLLRAVGGNATGNVTQLGSFNIKPVTSVAVSFDGQVVAAEYWDTTYVLYTARLPYRVEAPGDCLPLEMAVYVPGTNIAYIYTLEKSGVLYVPYGRVELTPLYRYMGDVRCRPERNFTLTIYGDVVEPLVLRYVKEFRVYKWPPGAVRGPDWASGPASFAANMSLPVQDRVEVEALPSLADRLQRLQALAAGMARALFDGWEVDGRPAGVGFPLLSVNVDKPTTIRAVYRLEAPATVSEGVYGINLIDVVVYDLAGNVVGFGRTPRFSAYPVVAVLRYKPSFLVAAGPGATVNGTNKLWATYGSTVVASATQVVEYRNKTRAVFSYWAETEEREPTLVATVTGPLNRTPVYVRQYLVYVAPPARIEGVEGNVTWVDRGRSIRVVAPQVIREEAGVRTVFKNWVINGVPNATLTSPVQSFVVERPLNITFDVKRQFLVTFSTAYGSVLPQTWADEGATVAVVPTPTGVWSPPPIHWVFKGWRDVATGVVYNYPQMPVAYGPAHYEAVWALDPVPLLVIAGAVAGAVFLVWFLRRRKLARLMAEVAE